MSAAPWVVKLGGRAAERAEDRARLACALALAPAPVVLVHGGADAVTTLQRRLGLEPRFVAGRRVTSDQDLAAVEMALSGAANKALVRALLAAGLQAAGVSGCDGGLLRCRLVPGLGRVGAPDRVDPALILALLAAGFTPVVSPVGLGPDGGAVNVNADDAACALAAALHAERLLLLSDVEGVAVGGGTLRELGADEVERLIAGGEARDGMIPKLRAAAAAVRAGVAEVAIGAWRGGPLAEVTGTRVRMEAAHGAA